MLLKNPDECSLKMQTKVPSKHSHKNFPKKKLKRREKKKGEAAEIVADIKSQLIDLAKVCVCVQEASFYHTPQNVFSCNTLSHS